MSEIQQRYFLAPDLATRLMQQLTLTLFGNEGPSSLWASTPWEPFGKVSVGGPGNSH